MIVQHRVDLRCHPSTAPAAVHGIEVLVRRPTDAQLGVTFRLEGDVGRIHIPSQGQTRIGKELWHHTCFEAFIAIDGQAAYHEFNFAPSREWTLYAFSGYRNGGPSADETILSSLAVHSDPRRLEADAVVRLDTLSSAHARASLRIGLSAIIEADNGFSYWALRHLGDKPDFHDPDSFMLLLGPPGLMP